MNPDLHFDLPFGTKIPNFKTKISKLFQSDMLMYFHTKLQRSVYDSVRKLSLDPLTFNSIGSASRDDSNSTNESQRSHPIGRPKTIKSRPGEDINPMSHAHTHTH